MNALDFETDYEKNLIDLYNDINQGRYQPGKAIAFVVDKPVKREIFAADFRDRIVHHLVISKLNPLFEKIFIHDNYACRVGRGTHFGISRADGFIRKCSHNYTKDCYVLKLDIRGFFMHIDKDILFTRLDAFIRSNYKGDDELLLLSLCRKLIQNDPTTNCVFKGDLRLWDDLPTDKSLFHSPPHCGLPIGNLTSQIFANFYLNAFDHFIKHDLGIRFYGRYVDDFILVHNDRAYLQSLIHQIAMFLKHELKLTLHPKKIYLQHYNHGVKFLGAIIKPRRIYVAHNIKGNFYNAIKNQNKICENRTPTAEEKVAFLCAINAYLGLLKHYKTYALRKKALISTLSPWWWNLHYSSGGFSKLVAKQRKSTSKHGILF